MFRLAGLCLAVLFIAVCYPEGAASQSARPVSLATDLGTKFLEETSVPLHRTWTDPPRSQLWTTGTDENASSFLFNPGQIETGPDDAVYVLDRGDYSIKAFDEDGGFLHAVAGSRGEGPGELANPTDFDIDDSGRVWIADPPNGRVSVYDADGTFSHHLRLEHQPQRIDVVDGGQAFYTAWLFPTDEAIFARYDAEGTIRQMFGPIVENQAKRGMALDGWIAVAPDRSLYYTPARAGRLMEFGPGDTQTLDGETVDPAPLPDVIVDDRGGRRVDPSASIITLGLQVVEDNVVVFSVLPDDTERSRAYDVYDRTGRYQHSIPLPDKTSDAHVTPDRIYTVTDASLIGWVAP